MSTSTAGARPTKHYTTAEIEAAVAAAPHTAPQTCEDLCASIQGDMDTLQNLQDFPANRRAAIRSAIQRDITALNREMKQQHCPACD